MRRTKAIHIWVEMSDEGFLAFAETLTGDADDLGHDLEQLISKRLGLTYPELSVKLNRDRVQQRALETWGRQFLERLYDENE